MVHILLINKLAFPIQQVTAGKKTSVQQQKYTDACQCVVLYFFCVFMNFNKELTSVMTYMIKNR